MQAIGQTTSSFGLSTPRSQRHVVVTADCSPSLGVLADVSWDEDYETPPSTPYYTSQEIQDHLDVDKGLPPNIFQLKAFKKLRKRLELPEDERILEYFSCALELKILHQGWMFLTQHFVCFCSKVFGQKTLMALPFSSVSKIEKKMSALFVPNAICIQTFQEKYLFTSFVRRDYTIRLLSDLWEMNHHTKSEASPSSSDLHTPTHSISSCISPFPNHIDSTPSSSSRKTFCATTTTTDDDEALLMPTPLALTFPQTNENENNDSKVVLLVLESKCVESESDGSEEEEDDFGSNNGTEFEHKGPITMHKIVDTYVQMSCRSVFQKFFSDRSSFFMDFHAQRNDFDISIGPWLKQDKNKGGRTRKLVFSSPIRQPFGPKTATVFETHKYVFLDRNKTKLLVEMISATPGVPYGDTFRLEYRIDVREQPDPSSPLDRVRCHLTLSVGVRMLKSTLLRSTIEVQGLKEATQSHQFWIELLQAKAKTFDPNEVAKKRLTRKSSITFSVSPTMTTARQRLSHDGHHHHVHMHRTTKIKPKKTKFSGSGSHSQDGFQSASQQSAASQPDEENAHFPDTNDQLDNRLDLNSDPADPECLPEMDAKPPPPFSTRLRMIGATAAGVLLGGALAGPAGAVAGAKAAMTISACVEGVVWGVSKSQKK